MLRSDFYFDLPQELIAFYPSKERTGCRMLCLDGKSGQLEDRHFYDLGRQLLPGDLLVFNDTRVIPARLYGHKETGGQLEILLERLISEQEALVHIKASKAPRGGSTIFVSDGTPLEMVARQGDLFRIRSAREPILRLLERAGQVPLPPYIERPVESLDRERYQTVYSKHPGAVAAPTAGLHFDEPQLHALKEQGINFAFVTLHVGAGTFQPVREEEIQRHQMHSEYVELGPEVAQAVIDTHRRGGRVIAVGTTAVRSLESAASLARAQGSDQEIVPFSQETSIFIYPGYRYQVVDALITNFHLPESTLIMLVSAFAGHANTMRAYQHAVQSRYHFFSYGDCMFITRNPAAEDDLPPSAREDA